MIIGILAAIATLLGIGLFIYWGFRLFSDEKMWDDWEIDIYE